MMKAFYAILLLIGSNVFMTFAWYGHLYFKKMELLKNTGLLGAIMISWVLAFFEYMLQVPANKIGFRENGGPFDLVQLKTLQEAISLTVFIFINVLVFKGGRLQWNHALGFALIILAVFVIFKEWK